MIIVYRKNGSAEYLKI